MAKKKVYPFEHDLVNENGSPKWLPNEFFYNEIQLNGYQLQDREGEPVLFVKYGDASDLQAVTKKKACNDSDLLMKMLKLKVDLPAILFESRDRLSFGKLKYEDDEEQKEYEKIENAAIERIKEWCETNGFPFKPDMPEGKRKAKSLVHLHVPSYIGFTISDFIYRLNDLYSFFLLYQIITGQPNRLSSTSYISNPKKGNSLQDVLISLKDISADEAKALFESKYQDVVFTNTLSLKNGLHWETYATDLFDAAFYQLALLINGYGREIKICPLCHNYFVGKRKNQKYCGEPCYPELAYIRKKRAKQKAVKP